MEFFKPAWESKDPKKRLVGVGRLKNPEKLYRIIFKEHNEEIVKAGILQLSILGANDYIYRICSGLFYGNTGVKTFLGIRNLFDFILDKITDEDVLVKIASHRRVIKAVGEKALVKISSSIKLKEIALRCEEIDKTYSACDPFNAMNQQNIAFEALHRIENEHDLVSEIAQNAKNHKIRQEAYIILGDVEAVRTSETQHYTSIYVDDKRPIAERISAYAQVYPEKSELCQRVRFLLDKDARKCEHNQEFTQAKHTERKEAAEFILDAVKKSPNVLGIFTDEIKKEIEQAPGESKAEHVGLSYDGESSLFVVYLHGVGLKWPN